MNVSGLERYTGGMIVATKKKIQVVAELEATFNKCSVGIITDYRGLNTTELNEIRRKLREANIEYRVVKNSLALLALKQAGMEHAARAFQGPVAIAFGYGEIPEPAKVLTEYIRNTKSVLNITAGFLPDRFLSSGEVESLARLPSREVLISQVMAGIQSPITGLVNVLAGPIRGIMGVLQARMKQLEGA